MSTKSVKSEALANLELKKTLVLKALDAGMSRSRERLYKLTMSPVDPISKERLMLLREVNNDLVGLPNALAKLFDELAQQVVDALSFETKKELPLFKVKFAINDAGARKLIWASRNLNIDWFKSSKKES